MECACKSISSVLNCTCVFVLLVATIQAQIVVGFNSEDQPVSEGGGSGIQVTHTGNNVNNINVTATPMTLAQFNQSRGGDLGSLPQDVQNANEAIQDPAECRLGSEVCNVHAY